MSYLVAVDPGSRKFGYAVFDLNHSEPKLVEYDTVFVNKIEGIKGCPSIYQRLKAISQFATKLQKKYTCSQLIIEEAFMAKNADSAMKLSMARGAFLAAFAVNDVEIFEYAALKVKSIGALNSKASKDDVIRTMQLIYGLESVTEDAADAIAIGRTHILLSSSVIARAGRVSAENPTGAIEQGAYRAAKQPIRSRGKKSNVKSRALFEESLRLRGAI